MKECKFRREMLFARKLNISSAGDFRFFGHGKDVSTFGTGHFLRFIADDFIGNIISNSALGTFNQHKYFYLIGSRRRDLSFQGMNYITMWRK